MCLIIASVTMLLIALLDDNEAKPSIIVSYLMKRNVALSHCYNSANAIEPREPHTCNNNNSILFNALTQQPQESITESAQTIKVQKYDMHNQMITETAPANIAAILLLLPLPLLLVLLIV
jgi:hypothetical protein